MKSLHAVINDAGVDFIDAAEESVLFFVGIHVFLDILGGQTDPTQKFLDELFTVHIKFFGSMVDEHEPDSLWISLLEVDAVVLLICIHRLVHEAYTLWHTVKFTILQELLDFVQSFSVWTGLEAPILQRGDHVDNVRVVSIALNEVEEAVYSCLDSVASDSQTSCLCCI